MADDFVLKSGTVEIGPHLPPLLAQGPTHRPREVTPTQRASPAVWHEESADVVRYSKTTLATTAMKRDISKLISAFECRKPVKADSRKCFECNKVGHLARNCPSKLKSKSK